MLKLLDRRNSMFDASMQEHYTSAEQDQAAHRKEDGVGRYRAGRRNEPAGKADIGNDENPEPELEVGDFFPEVIELRHGLFVKRRPSPRVDRVCPIPPLDFP